MVPKEMESPGEIKKAFDAANQMTWTREELDAYDYKGIAIQDERGRLEYAVTVAAKEAREKALVEGRAEGRAEGRVEGRVEGRGEGRAEGIEHGIQLGVAQGKKKGKLETAKRMLERGISKEDILAFTDLSEEDMRQMSTPK